jgi:hypothetical protein
MTAAVKFVGIKRKRQIMHEAESKLLDFVRQIVTDEIAKGNRSWAMRKRVSVFSSFEMATFVSIPKTPLPANRSLIEP